MKIRLLLILVIIIVLATSISANEFFNYGRNITKPEIKGIFFSQDGVQSIIKTTSKSKLNFYFSKNILASRLLNPILMNLKIEQLVITQNDTQVPCSLLLKSRCDGDELISFIKKDPKPSCQDYELGRRNCRLEQNPNPVTYPTECYDMGCRTGLLGSSCTPKLKPKDQLPEWCVPITENPCIKWLEVDIESKPQEECCVPGKTEDFKINERLAQGIVDLAKQVEKGNNENVISAIGGVCAASFLSELGLENRFDLFRRVREMSKFGPITVGGSLEKAKITYQSPNCPGQKISVEVSKDQITFGCEIKF